MPGPENVSVVRSSTDTFILPPGGTSTAVPYPASRYVPPPDTLRDHR